MSPVCAVGMPMRELLSSCFPHVRDSDIEIQCFACMGMIQVDVHHFRTYFQYGDGSCPLIGLQLCYLSRLELFRITEMLFGYTLRKVLSVCTVAIFWDDCDDKFFASSFPL